MHFSQIILFALVVIWMAAPVVALAQQQVGLFVGGGANSSSNRVVWKTFPGVRYELQQSTNLSVWTTSFGFPTLATGPVQQAILPMDGPSTFFRVAEIDEQPPSITNRSPGAGAFAVNRFSSIAISLSDSSPILPESLQLIVGALGAFDLQDEELTFTNSTLLFTPTNATPLGAHGETVEITLRAADIHGNIGTNNWSFELELLPVVATNLFVFGSSNAMQFGQQVPPALAAMFGQKFQVKPTAANDPNAWILHTVSSNSLLIYYSNSAPSFSEGTFLCNLAPRNADEVFTRRVLSVSNDLANKQLTLATTNVGLEQIVTNGSLTLSTNSIFLETDTNGAFSSAFTFSNSGTNILLNFPISLAGLRFSLSDETNGQEIVRIEANELTWSLSSRLSWALKIENGVVERVESIITGQLSESYLWNAQFRFPGIARAYEQSIPLPAALSRGRIIFFGSIGGVPIIGRVHLETQFEASAQVSAGVDFSWSSQENSDVAIGFSYRRPYAKWVRELTKSQPQRSQSLVGAAGGSLNISLVPEVNFIIYGVAGVSMSIIPSADFELVQTSTQPLYGKATWGVRFEISPAGLLFKPLKRELTASFLLWEDYSYFYSTGPLIAFDEHPHDRTVEVGKTAHFSCAVSAPEAPAYQWFHNGIEKVGETSRSLIIRNVNFGDAGNYTVRASVGGAFSNSNPARLTVVEDALPANMVLIPAGQFLMGDALGDVDLDDEPTHSVYTDPFYMDVFETTKELWDDVRFWASNHQYQPFPASVSQGNDHPATYITWRDAVRWCNARSEMEQRAPVYFTDANLSEVFRFRTNTPIYVNWAAKGYRLPTEAEWEKAARGGSSIGRFPWPFGFTVSHQNANYFSSSIVPYNVVEPFGYHPAVLALGPPRSRPVGSFLPNRYGLFDMAGNVAEWCWDVYSATYYSSSPLNNPKGPSSGSLRVLRGGSYDDYGWALRNAARYKDSETVGYFWYGFRCVMPAKSP